MSAPLATTSDRGGWAKALLKPGSVALVGISDDPGKTSGRPLQFLRRAGFAQAIYPINPTRDTVQGETAYPSLSALPERPDHAFILTGTERALDALEECGRLGIPVATILSSGFSESGVKGEANEQRLRHIIDRYDLRVLGPSSIGIVNLHHRLVLTANAAFAEPDLPVGGIFVGSHSGSLIGALVSRGKERGLGFAGLVSVGGESDLSIGEICAATLDDPQVTSYMLFIETMRHADQLRAFAMAAAQRGKPVAAYKLGRSSEAAELAVSHTGALAGEDDVADAFLRDCGIARVESFDGLLEIMPLLRHLPLRRNRRPRVGIVTTTGGGAAMAVDQLALRGVDIATPSDATRARLANAEIECGHGRILDLTLAGTRYEVMKATLDIMLTAPEFDLVLATVGSSARFHPDLAVKPVIDVALDHKKPVAAFIVPAAPDALRRLAQAGVPAFGSPETCADAIAAAFARRPPRDIARKEIAPSTAQRMLDETQAYALFARVGIRHAPVAVLDPGAPVPDLAFSYPVVAKVLHPDIAHKSDAGGVILNIASPAELGEAIGLIKATVEARVANVEVDRVLVQPMVRGVGEVLVGLRRDPQAGPVVMLAAGGIYTELYRDRSLRLAPVDLETAHAMIREVKATRMLQGYRGKPEGDIEALAAAIVAVSQLVTLSDVDVLEAEINPLLVLEKGQGVIAVDALVSIGEVS